MIPNGPGFHLVTTVFIAPGSEETWSLQWDNRDGGPMRVWMPRT